MAGKKARTKRGYNHSAVIARTIVEFGRHDGLDIEMREDILIKRREVPQQARTRGKEERAKNVESVFGLQNGEYLHEKTVILIDDVITTGATITEARRALKAMHPKRVLAIAVAH
jgi:predicted amidophosphoribosyltransferase